MKKKEKDNVEDNESEDKADDSDADIDNSNHDLNKNKFHYIITETDESVPLPKIIEILEPYPGEPRWMRKRTGPAVIRYHKVNRDNQYESWMLNELMLYTHYREADLDEYENKTA